MKYLILLLLPLSSFIYGQEIDNPIPCDSSRIFTFVSQMPTCKGGIENLKEQIASEIEIDKKIQGIVIIKFTVNCKGESFNHTIMRGTNTEIDKKILEKFIEKSEWESANHNGKDVDCYLMIGLKIKKGDIR